MNVLLLPFCPPGNVCSQQVYPVASNTPNDGTTPWVIPTTLPLGKYVIRVSDAAGPSLFDESDAPFDVVAVNPSDFGFVTYHGWAWANAVQAQSPHPADLEGATATAEAGVAVVAVALGAGDWNSAVNAATAARAAAAAVLRVTSAAIPQVSEPHFYIQLRDRAALALGQAAALGASASVAEDLVGSPGVSPSELANLAVALASVYGTLDGFAIAGYDLGLVAASYFAEAIAMMDDPASVANVVSFMTSMLEATLSSVQHSLALQAAFGLFSQEVQQTLEEISPVLAEAMSHLDSAAVASMITNTSAVALAVMAVHSPTVAIALANGTLSAHLGLAPDVAVTVASLNETLGLLGLSFSVNDNGNVTVHAADENAANFAIEAGLANHGSFFSDPQGGYTTVSPNDTNFGGDPSTGEGGAVSGGPGPGGGLGSVEAP